MADAVAEEPAADEVPPAKDDSKPEIPFDVKTMDLIIDFRSVCSLPYDTDVEGTKALRAIKFGKGSGIHAPNETGKFIVCGEWTMLLALSKVYFVECTHRQPELLVGFVDYGFCNVAMSGISVETLALPLQIRKGVYQDAFRLTRIEDVAGFSTIKTGQAPWAMHLKPALSKHEMFRAFKIFSREDINKWLSTQTMEKRVETLAKRARVAMADAVKDLARQDATQASKTKALFEAKLAGILTSIAALPPSAYDVRMTARILKLVEGEDREGDPLWLTSPMHKGMREGTAQFLRTRLHGAAVAAAAPAAAVVEVEPIRQPAIEQVPVEPQPNKGTGVDDLELSESDGEESDVDSGVEEVAPPRGSTRAKRAPKRLANELQAAKGAAKKANTNDKAESKEAKQIYKRGPYNKSGASAAKAIAKAEKTELKKALSSSADKLEIANLKVQLKAALEAKKAAEELVKQSSRMTELEISKAYAEGEKRGLQFAGEEYKKGIAAGAAIASGKSFSFSEETPRGRVPSSVGGHSSAWSSDVP